MGFLIFKLSYPQFSLTPQKTYLIPQAFSLALMSSVPTGQEEVLYKIDTLA